MYRGHRKTTDLRKISHRRLLKRKQSERFTLKGKGLGLLFLTSRAGEEEQAPRELLNSATDRANGLVSSQTCQYQELTIELFVRRSRNSDLGIELELEENRTRKKRGESGVVVSSGQEKSMNDRAM